MSEKQLIMDRVFVRVARPSCAVFAICSWFVFFGLGWIKAMDKICFLFSKVLESTVLSVQHVSRFRQVSEQ